VPGGFVVPGEGIVLGEGNLRRRGCFAALVSGAQPRLESQNQLEIYGTPALPASKSNMAWSGTLEPDAKTWMKEEERGLSAGCGPGGPQGKPRGRGCVYGNATRSARNFSRSRESTGSRVFAGDAGGLRLCRRLGVPAQARAGRGRLRGREATRSPRKRRSRRARRFRNVSC
jgi:hypothetical protein